MPGNQAEATPWLQALDVFAPARSGDAMLAMPGLRAREAAPKLRARGLSS